MSILNMVYGSWGGSDEPVYKGEYIEYKMNADSSWNLYVPISWYSTTGTTDCSYSWKISVDGWAETTYTWTGSNGGSITIGWYTANSEHTIKIVPTTESYWWARAYGWRSTTWRTYITEILYDSSYMWYAVSATDTWDYFRAFQYSDCSNLSNTPDEYLPNTVTTIWIHFRSRQFKGTWITEYQDEVMPDTVTSIWTEFRAYQFYWCSNLIEIGNEKLSDSTLTIWNSFRQHQFHDCTLLISSSIEALPDSITSIGSGFRISQYEGCSSLAYIKWWKDLSIWNATYRHMQYDSCTANKIIVVLSGVWYTSESSALNNSYVTQVLVPSTYLTTFQNTNNYPRVWITDSKFVWY